MGFGNRERLLALLKIFQDYCGDKNGITMEQLLSKLSQNYNGLKTFERKTIYRDIEIINTLTDLEIRFNRSFRAYSVNSRKKLSVEEIEVITNALLTAKFITKQNTRDLIKKFHDLTGFKKDKAVLNNIIVEDRVKIPQVDTTKNIEIIRKAIRSNKKIQFHYGKYNSKKQFIIEKNNCIVSPYENVWFQDFYYMLGNYKENILSHYRVDRLMEIKILDEQRKNISEITGNKQGLNVAEYMSKIIGMSSGNEEFVTIIYKKQYINEVIDTLGRNVSIYEQDQEHFTLIARVIISKKLTKWILGFGDGAIVVSPNSLKDDVR